MRLHHALILLADHTPVTAVAHQCGWSSASTFIDVFRRTFGHTRAPGHPHRPTRPGPGRVPGASRSVRRRTTGPAAA
ncbi:helix-turn-helix domain-containing protein [Streptomyces sp. KL116D]|uniref:helix-turn-helix domain-containing protein n=1 Tax=Streptomyces sp. KL116D TaxID=3045152 RepID=UPI00355722B3